MKRIPSLDGFRAISIILVIICHILFVNGIKPSWADPSMLGVIGVTVFFVISGFLITSLLLAEEAKTGRISIPGFYKRRAFRILPVFLLYVIFIVIWSHAKKVDVDKNEIIHALTFTVNFMPPTHNWYFSHFWTLSIEEQFYLVWPAVIVFFRKHLKITLYLFILYSCLCRVAAYKIPAIGTIILNPSFSHSDAIMIGALGGVLFFENASIINSRILRFGVLQITAVFFVFFFQYELTYGKFGIIALPFGNLIMSVSILFLLLSYIKPSDNIIYKFFNNKAVVHIGVLSYSIYIWQQFFIDKASDQFWKILLYNVVIIYPVALASYYCWEQPMIKLGKKPFFKKPQVTQSGA